MGNPPPLADGLCRRPEQEQSKANRGPTSISKNGKKKKEKGGTTVTSRTASCVHINWRNKIKVAEQKMMTFRPPNEMLLERWSNLVVGVVFAPAEKVPKELRLAVKERAHNYTRVVQK
jgi:hypothetical protein